MPPKGYRFKTQWQSFDEKYEKAPNGCWIWTAAHNGKGYGVFGRTPRLYAHRFAYEYYKGPIPLAVRMLTGGQTGGYSVGSAAGQPERAGM